MEKIVQQGILYDFYGELLTAHQKQVYEALVYENLSLAEIADDQGISRQAVHDIIKRTDRILQDYEDRLGLVSKFTKIRSRISEVDELLREIKDLHPDEAEKLEQIKSLCSEIQEII